MRSVLFRRLMLFGVPLALGILEIFHPVPGEQFFTSLPPNWWLTLHILQLPLFGLLAVAVLMLTNGMAGWLAIASRVGVWLFIVFYLAMDTQAGIAYGIVLREAQSLPPDQLEGIERVKNALFLDSITGADNPYALYPKLGVAAAGFALYNAGIISLWPVALLVLSGVLFGYCHEPPTGPLGMLCFLIAALWIEFVPKSKAAA